MAEGEQTLTKKVNYFLPARYNKQSNEYEIEMYTNVAENVRMDFDSEETVGSALLNLKDAVDEIVPTINENNKGKVLKAGDDGKAAWDNIRFSEIEDRPATLEEYGISMGEDNHATFEKDGLMSKEDKTILESVRSSIEAISGGATKLPRGIITMWYGIITAIPEGWALCDGQNGTPDLRNRFVVGAGGEYEAGNTGGTKTNTLAVGQLPQHNHGFSGSSGSDGAHGHTFSSGSAASSGSHNHTFSSGSAASSGSHNHTFSSGSAASGGSHNHSSTASNYDLVAQSASASTSSSTGGTLKMGYCTNQKTSSDGAHTHSVSGTISSSGAHTHSVSGTISSDGAHTHSVSGTISSSGSHSHSISGTVGNTGSGQAIENRPPFYALAFIMSL